jgi:hypothetical protein
LLIFATSAAVKAFDNLDAVEDYAMASAHDLSIGERVALECQDQDGNTLTIVTERLSDRLVVSVQGDPDRTAHCIDCRKAGRIHDASTAHLRLHGRTMSADVIGLRIAHD